MQLRTAERKKAKIKMALQGCAGSGKTYSSLLLAQGLSGGDFSKVAIIDTENGSADLYADLGRYNVVTLKPPFTPEQYIKAIEICENAGMEVVILDSITHAWEELLDFHSKLTGNSFTNWSKVTPRQNALIEKILQSDCHIVACMRTKQDYVLNQKDGKYIPEKVGLKAVQRDGVEYEFTLVFDIDIKHYAVASKDRTGLYINQPEFRITPETGKRILDWCNSGVTVEKVKELIQHAKTVEDLAQLYHKYPDWYPLLTTDFMNKKSQLKLQEEGINVSIINSNQNHLNNGNSNTATAS